MADSNQHETPASWQLRLVPLNPILDRKLFAYAIAATTAGVSLVALSQTATAEVVYTPANQTITGYYALDLNHDGVTDFTIINSHATFTSGLQFFRLEMSIQKPGRNRVLAGYGSRSTVFALPPRTKIGEGGHFPDYLATARMEYCLATRTSWRYSGSWFNVEQRYLGFKFSIGGEIHYGWARLNVAVRGPKCTSSALLTGYAYETVPNRPIITGKTSGAEESDLSESDQSQSDQSRPSMTLGDLALGRDNRPALAEK